MLVGLLFLVSTRADCTPKVRAGSFNIRLFPEGATDLERVAFTISELDADVFAVQEIRDAEVLQRVLAQASALTGRDYRFALTRCRSHRFRVATGVVWDARRWTLEERRDYPDLLPDDGHSCGDWVPALFAAFSDRDGRRLGVLAVHLPPFTHNYETRREHWRRLLTVQRRESEQLGATVLVLGDFNSTGFRGEPKEEREFVEGMVEEAGVALLSRGLECTEYYRPKGAAKYLPSVLDHVVASDGDWSSATALGLCERLGCEAVAPDAMDRDFFVVSDHCPIYVEGRPAQR